MLGRYDTDTMGHVLGPGCVGLARLTRRAVLAQPESPPTSPSTAQRHVVPLPCHAGIGTVQMHCAKEGGRDRRRRLKVTWAVVIVAMEDCRRQPQRT